MGENQTEKLHRRRQKQQELLPPLFAPEKETEAQSDADHKQTCAGVGVGNHQQPGAVPFDIGGQGGGDPVQRQKRGVKRQGQGRRDEYPPNPPKACLPLPIPGDGGKGKAHQPDAQKQHPGLGIHPGCLSQSLDKHKPQGHPGAQKELTLCLDCLLLNKGCTQKHQRGKGQKGFRAVVEDPVEPGLPHNKQVFQDTRGQEAPQLNPKGLAG